MLVQVRYLVLGFKNGSTEFGSLNCSLASGSNPEYGTLRRPVTSGGRRISDSKALKPGIIAWKDLFTRVVHRHLS